MKKLVILLFVMLQFGYILEARGNSSKEGFDVISTKENIVSGPTTRDESISGDITGHTLTITFNENVGIAHIVIKDSNGVYIDRESR